MKSFLKNLKTYANKYLNKDETNELVSYYEEIINERLLDGEPIEEIILNYNVQEIVKDALPNLILKRENNIFKNTLLVLLLLFSTPVLIPIAMVYLAIVIVIFSVFISFVAASISGILFIIPYLVETFRYATSLGQTLGLIAFGVIVATLIFYLSYGVAKLMYLILKANVKMFLNIFIKKRGQYEKIS